MRRLGTIFLIGILLCTGIPAKLFDRHSAAAEIVLTLLDTTFDENVENTAWRAERNCRAVVRGNLLHVEALQGLPQIFQRVNFIGGEFRLIMEIRTGTESEVSLYWTSRGSIQRNEENRVVVPLNDTGQWHTYEFLFTVPDELQSMMLRFSAPDGSWDIRSMKLLRRSRPPMSVQSAVPMVHEGQERVRFTVSNDVIVPMRFRIGSQTTVQTLPRGETVDLAAAVRSEGHLAAAVLRLHPQDFPSMIHPVFLYRPEGQTDWLRKPLADGMILEIAPDARMARLWQGNELFGIIAPIVHREGGIPKFVLAEDSTETELHFTSSDVDLRINLAPPFLHFEIADNPLPHPSPEGEEASESPLPEERVREDAQSGREAPLLEGPVVRLFGELRSGLLPGVEFLGPGGTSSSEIDVARPHHDRSRPNPQWITMPLAVLETEKGGAVLYWDDVTLQPIFSAPNRFDHTEDHRFSLAGSRIKASLELLPPAQPKEEPASFRAIRSYIAQKGFPPPPAALRTAEEQRQLFTDALSGRLQSELGGQWGRALEPQWERQPFADVFSTSARLTEAAGVRSRNPSLLVPGGSDISNDAIYFLSGRIQEWQRLRESAIQQITSMTNLDGSFLFRTRFPEVETAASSYGYTALQALAVMEYVRITGDHELFAAVTKALDYLEHCIIPSGGYYLDTPFHTPDLQAAATLVWLYTWAYEYSGNAHYLNRAVHFAYAGLPFVYQIVHTEGAEYILYGTVGKFGGTRRRLPLHFGILSTRAGIQYAYALNLLSKHDRQTDWMAAALGILQAAENLQYTDAERAGCVPEFFDVVKQERYGWTMNPCALVSLRWAVEGKVDSLFVLTDGRDRYTAPYPLRKVPEGIEAYNVPPGQRFHILHNANRYGMGEGSGLIAVD